MSGAFTRAINKLVLEFQAAALNPLFARMERF
jgi:hypothetical protein